MTFRIRTLLFLLTACMASVVARADDPPGSPVEFKALKYRNIGPSAGGRVCRACGVPGDPLTYYAATAGGGVWKSVDGGANWKPIFDDQPVSSIGSIAVAPSDANVVYVGAGEANIRGNVSPGNGIYRSTDAGKTWKHVWKQEGQIGTLIVHPRNADIAYAAVLGHAFGPNPERGVYRTTDGGKSWQRVLARDADTGASDVALDPSNPRTLVAGFWQTRRRPWQLTSGGPGSGLWQSHDGGDSWKQLGPFTEAQRDKFDDDAPGKGLPEGPWGKVCVAIAPSDGRRIYALIEAEKGGLYRSDDGGKSWDLINPHRILRQRAWYFSTLTIDPKNPDVVWFPQVPLLKSVDGGKSLRRVKGPHHVDHHDLWIDPLDPRRMIDSNDGGVDISLNGGETWFAPPLPISQFYHIAADHRTPYHVSGCMQDLGSACGPSNSLGSGGIALGDWEFVGGGEAGFTAHDPHDPNVVYAGEYGGYVSRFDRRSRQSRNIGIYPTNPSGHGAEDLRYRFQWTAPILISPHDSRTVYHAANVLFRTTDGGRNWAPASPDLTRNDRTKQGWSGGPITGDNTGVEVYGTIFALAESPRERGLLWVGTDDGRVHRTDDGGKTWHDLNAALPGLPEWGTVACIEPSSFDAATAYLVVDAHRLDDMRPYLYKTADRGKTWRALATGLPRDAQLHAVREDPKRKGLLYVGSERGVWVSTDDGTSWRQLKLNLPTVAVHDLVVKDNDLVVGTHGRSVWILDDLTPLREGAPAVLEQETHLFAVPPSTRWHYHASRVDGADNPPAGAVIHYHLKQKAKGDVVLEVLDAAGKRVARHSSKEEEKDSDDDPDVGERDKKEKPSTAKGVQRFVWDLRHEGAVKLRKVKVDWGEVDQGPLALPGSYQVRLTVDGRSYVTPLQIVADPRSAVAPAEVAEGHRFVLRLRDDLTRAAQLIMQLRSVRGQVTARAELLKEADEAEDLVRDLKAVADKLDGLEAKLHNPKAQVAYDILAQRGGAQLYSKLVQLYEFGKEGDGPTTQGMREVHDELAKELSNHEAALDGLLAGDVKRLNEAARMRELPAVLVPPREKVKK